MHNFQVPVYYFDFFFAEDITIRKVLRIFLLDFQIKQFVIQGPDIPACR